jgi:ethanolamine permease
MMKQVKEILFYMAVCVGVAISSSSFTIIAGLNEIMSGGWILLSIFVGGILCFGVARLIGELASMYPSAPGIRTYLLRGFTNKISLFFVFVYIIFVVLIGSVESYMFGLVVQSVFPHFPIIVTIIALIVAIVSINCIGLELPRNIQIVATCILVTGVFAFGMMGIVHSEAPSVVIESFKDTSQAWLFPASIGFSIFLFMGFEWATSLGLNSKAYLKKIPRSMQSAIVINTLVYIIFCWGLSLSIPQKTIASSRIPHILMAHHQLGEWGLYVGLFVSFLAIVATFNAGVMGGARFVYVVAREGYLPPLAAKISLKYGSPIGAVILLCSLVLLNSIVVYWYQLEIVFALISSSIICFIYAALMLSLLRIKAANKKLKINYEGKIPVWIHWTLVVILSVFGVLTLFSISEAITSVLFGMIFILLVAQVAAACALKFKEKNKLKKEEERNLEPSTSPVSV